MVRYPDPAALVGEVLLDQRVACGVGNVYRSEVLFAEGVHPFLPIGTLDPATARRLIETSARLLRANLHHSARITTVDDPGGLAVYGRAGRPCVRCGRRIESRRLGDHSRGVFWCPTCQPHPG
jgi:endonuclease-8